MSTHYCVENFIGAEMIEMTKFAVWWHEQQRTEGVDKFPHLMTAGDWWEQYMMWCDSHEG